MVSVIIPVYNGEEFLEQCLRSVVNQSYKDLEIIIIDDGSTDRSYSICEKLAQADHRIHLIRQDNAGVSAARNHGISFAKGEFITFVDADDLLLEGAIDVMVKAAVSGADFVIGSYEAYRFGRTKKVLFGAKEYINGTIKSNFPEIDTMISAPWGKLYKREVILKHGILFMKSVPYGEDHIFNVEYCRFAKKIVVLDVAVYRYWIGGMASSIKYHENRNESDYLLLEVYKTFYSEVDIPLSFLIKKVRDQLNDCFMHYIVHCRYKKSLAKITETLTMYAPFLNETTVNCNTYSTSMAECVLNNNAVGLRRLFLKEHFVRIMLRKAKRIYYALFSKRI